VTRENVFSGKYVYGEMVPGEIVVGEMVREEMVIWGNVPNPKFHDSFEVPQCELYNLRDLSNIKKLSFFTLILKKLSELKNGFGPRNQ
jgi:hypothetical protein